MQQSTSRGGYQQIDGTKRVSYYRSSIFIKQMNVRKRVHVLAFITTVFERYVFSLLISTNYFYLGKNHIVKSTWRFYLGKHNNGGYESYKEGERLFNSIS